MEFISGTLGHAIFSISSDMCHSPSKTRHRFSCFTIQNSQTMKCRSFKDTWHSSVMTCGTHFRSIGCIIHPFMSDMCHSLFMTRRHSDVVWTCHFETVLLREIFMLHNPKLSSVEVLKHDTHPSGLVVLIHGDTWLPSGPDTWHSFLVIWVPSSTHFLVTCVTRLM
jgi:hypothetical protein